MMYIDSGGRHCVGLPDDARYLVRSVNEEYIEATKDALRALNIPYFMRLEHKHDIHFYIPAENFQENRAKIRKYMGISVSEKKETTISRFRKLEL